MLEKIIPEIREKLSFAKPDADDIYDISGSKRPPWVVYNDKINTADEIIVNLGKGMETVDKGEIKEATQMVKESILFIKENASTEAELKTAETLETMAKEGRVFIGDTSQDIGYPVYGYFHPEYDPMTGKDTGYIVIDHEGIMAYGKSEAIDTLSHEAYHAAQHEEGHENDCVEEETRAWNMGLEMSNRYREETGEHISQTEPYTQSDIENKGYTRDLGEGVFAELTGNSTEVLA